ncbi:hypothetical protein K488DRAFT_87473 [Vararia minispora EC-137]|uniref:Uncharacterized protein n=1 Tax=Vararia minispora EC-137 TaxID=1314806 RepID=A0ACB8QG15_9AGAM|nr:hypothetical protein K488DRAFT_87473 [Vararia minispora EC-137]
MLPLNPIQAYFAPSLPSSVMADPALLSLANKFIATSSSILNSQPSFLSVAEESAREIANQLRVKSQECEYIRFSPHDNQSGLGATQLPAALTTLIKGSLDGRSTPRAETLSAVYETLRVAANLCMDHDGNRQQLLDADFPQSLVTMLGGYASRLPSEYTTKPIRLSTADLKVLKTAIGVLLNAIVGYEPVKSSIGDAAIIILRLSCAIYPPGAWQGPDGRAILPEDVSEPSDEAIQESWTLRAGLSSWAWRTLDELKEDSQPLFEPNALPELTRPLRAFIPPSPSSDTPAYFIPTLTRSLISTDFEAFEESCSTLEGLVVDDEDACLSLARGLNFPDEHNGARCLDEILLFIEAGTYHPLWSLEPVAERARREKAFDLCKAALIKSVVEVAGEEKNTEVLWDDSDEKNPGGPFVAQMVGWIKTHKNLRERMRDDLVICATLSLGNLVRHESHSLAIVNAPVSLSPYLSDLLEPDTDIKVKHGVIALLRHLAYTPAARTSLADARIIERLVSSNIFKDTADTAELVQVNAIGIAKNLCNGNAQNCFSLVLDMNGLDSEVTGLRQILALVKRSDKTVVKSEGTRVLVNVIRTLWSSATLDSEQRRMSMGAVTSPTTALALAQLIGRSKKYPVLINEAMVALTLLSLTPVGAKCALDALTAILPSEVPAAAFSAGSGETSPDGIQSPVVAPGRALDMLEYVLKNKGPRFPEEISVNVCLLIGQVSRRGGVGEERSAELAAFMKETRPLLEAEVRVEGQSKLKSAAEQALAKM